MDLRALHRLSLITGLGVFIAALVWIRRMHTEERGMELLLIGTLAVGAFLAISGLVGMIAEPPLTYDEEEEELAETQLRSRRPISIASAVGIYIVALSVIAAIVVGIAAGDAGAGIQTFTFGLILGGVIWGLGVLLGYRPVEDEA